MGFFVDNPSFIAILKYVEIVLWLFLIRGPHVKNNETWGKMCRGGEIGRHAALRWLWEKSHRGSSPLSGTSFRQGFSWRASEDLRKLSAVALSAVALAKEDCVGWAIK